MLCAVIALLPAAGAVLGFMYGPAINRFLKTQVERTQFPVVGALA